MTAPPALPPKKDVMLALLERSSVFINLDPRSEAVRVPAWFKKQPQLVLQVGLNMAVRIPDLDVGDEAVSCTLSFNRSPFFCWIPWSAVFALVAEDGKGMIWPTDIPKEVAAAQAERAQKEQPKPDHLRPVAPVASSAAVAAPQKKAEPGKRGRKRSPARLKAESEKEAGSPKVVAQQEAAPAPEPTSAESAPPRDSRGPEAKNRGEKRPLPSYLRVVK